MEKNKFLRKVIGFFSSIICFSLKIPRCQKMKKNEYLGTKTSKLLITYNNKPIELYIESKALKGIEYQEIRKSKLSYYQGPWKE